MKSIALSAAILSISFSSWGQNNTFPTTGNVGVGTTSPSKPLFVVGENWQESPSVPKVFAVADPSDLTKTISLGYDDTYDAGVLVSVDQSTGWKNTLIQPFGGNVGIGTTNPSVKLDIAQGGTSTLVTRVSSGGHVNFRLSRGSNSYDGGYFFYTGSTLDWRFQQGSNGNNLYIRDESIGSNVMTFQDNTGNIGIGTSSPVAKLDIEGGNLYVGEESSNNGTRRELRVYGYDSNQKFYGSLHSNYDDSKRTFDISSSSYAHQLKIDASANVNGRIAILPGDNVGVGIGTLTTGTHKLAVEGTIGAREIKVEASGWSDFVFKEDYELRTLEEVAEHIAEKRHLPEIPSEAEVTENGINLGEMDAKLLQKIEELTLYMIDMNKRMSQLETENQELKGKVKSLENE